MIYLFFAIAAAFRLAALAVSIRNEKALRAAGAVEYDSGNSRRLALLHTAFYLVAFGEGIYRGGAFDAAALLGLALWLFGASALVAVILLLGRLWTVKLMIAPGHRVVTHALFRWVRHPNYYLNILPELVGYALVMHAYVTLVVGLALYAFPLIHRIREEERVMRERVPGYA